MVTENILKFIEELEIKNEKLKFKNIQLENEVKKLNDLISNINFDYDNMYRITREISNLYHDLKVNERNIEWNNQDINDSYEKLIDSVSQEEYDEIKKQRQKENEQNLDSDLREISAKYELVEILSPKEIKVKKDNSTWSRYTVTIKHLSDNSYQFRTHQKSVNVKRKSTVIKYLAEFMN